MSKLVQLKEYQDRADTHRLLDMFLRSIGVRMEKALDIDELFRSLPQKRLSLSNLLFFRGAEGIARADKKNLPN